MAQETHAKAFMDRIAVAVERGDAGGWRVRYSVRVLLPGGLGYTFSDGFCSLVEPDEALIREGMIQFMHVSWAFMRDSGAVLEYGTD